MFDKYKHAVYAVKPHPSSPPERWLEYEADMLELNTVRFGYAQPLYYIQHPDGTRQHFITRAKFIATLAVLRLNHPDLKLSGQIPPPKQRKK